MSDESPTPRITFRIHLDGKAMLGPGKAELLARIAATGSIAAAARDMGMSYKRAWSLIEVLNSMFDAPLVASMRGGAAKGGAVLTDRGEAVLSEYRAVQAALDAAAEGSLGRLRAWHVAEKRRDTGD